MNIYEQARKHNKIDPEIIYVLDIFNDLGFMPVNSCWGHSIFEPYVSFYYDEKTLDFLIKMQSDLMHAPFRIGIRNNVLGRTISITMEQVMVFRADYAVRINKWWDELYRYLLSYKKELL